MKNDFQSSMVRTAALQTLPVDELRALWDKHVPRQPELSRNYLETRLSYQFEKMTCDEMQAVIPRTQIEAEAKRCETKTRIGQPHVGVWKGRTSTLGYVIAQQRVVVEPVEAKTVRYIFERFLRQPSVTALVQELTVQGVKTKALHTKTGRQRGGHAFDKNALYKLLNNRMYLGELFYDDAWHASGHQPLIEKALWDDVHELMVSRARRTGVPNHKSPEWQFPLKGLLFGEDGRRMTPWMSSKKRSRQFGYYIPQKEISVGAGASGLPRLSAYRLHAQVMEHLRENFRDPTNWFAAMPQSLTDHPAFDQALITERLREMAKESDTFSLLRQAKLIRQLVERVVIGPNDFLVHARLKGVHETIFETLLACKSDCSQAPDRRPND